MGCCVNSIVVTNAFRVLMMNLQHSHTNSCYEERSVCPVCESQLETDLFDKIHVVQSTIAVSQDYLYVRGPVIKINVDLFA